VIDQEILEKMPGKNTHPALQIDSLRDLVFEAYQTINVTTCGVTNTVMAIQHIMAAAPEHPAVQNMADTLDHSVLAIVLNRSSESMTSVAKRHINPNTGKSYTRAAISKKALDVADRLGIRFRAGKSESARKSYEARARRHHDKRRRETPKFNTGALLKGLQCKHK
jgi:hypothetical protein